jgi:hypothetical protein
MSFFYAFMLRFRASVGPPWGQHPGTDGDSRTVAFRRTLTSIAKTKRDGALRDRPLASEGWGALQAEPRSPPQSSPGGLTVTRSLVPQLVQANLISIPSRVRIRGSTSITTMGRFLQCGQKRIGIPGLARSVVVSDICIPPRLKDSSRAGYGLIRETGSTGCQAGYSAKQNRSRRTETGLAIFRSR